MKKSKFTEEQILGFIEQYNQGKKVTRICRELDIALSTFYHWRSTRAGNEPDQLTMAKGVEATLIENQNEPSDGTMPITILRDLN